MTRILTLRIHSLFLCLFLLFSTIGCDQATKTLAKDTLPGLNPIEYLGGSLRFEYAENSGAFMSLGSSLPQDIRFLIFGLGVSIFLILATVYLLKSNLDLSQTLAWTFVIAGGIGNLIDRISNGFVVDFINIGIGNFRTGIFNVADIAIVMGILFLLLGSVFAPLKGHGKKLSLR